MLDPWALELQMVVSRRVNMGNWPWVFWKSSMYSELQAISPAPFLCIFMCTCCCDIYICIWAHMIVKGQLNESLCFLLLHGFWRLNSGHQAWPSILTLWAILPVHVANIFSHDIVYINYRIFEFVCLESFQCLQISLKCVV